MGKHPWKVVERVFKKAIEEADRKAGDRAKKQTQTGEEERKRPRPQEDEPKAKRPTCGEMLGKHTMIEHNPCMLS